VSTIEALGCGSCIAAFHDGDARSLSLSGFGEVMHRSFQGIRVLFRFGRATTNTSYLPIAAVSCFSRGFIGTLGVNQPA
jgi:hypothetical protein